MLPTIAPSRMFLLAMTLSCLPTTGDGFVMPCPGKFRSSVCMQAAAVAPEMIESASSPAAKKTKIPVMAHRAAPRTTVPKEKRLEAMREIVRQRGSEALDDERIADFLSRELMGRSSLSSEEESSRGVGGSFHRDELLSDMLWYTTNPGTEDPEGVYNRKKKRGAEMEYTTRGGFDNPQASYIHGGKMIGDTARRHNMRNARKHSSTQDFQDYSQTELLQPEEEYILGMKIQFMMKCNDVYMGLSAHLKRPPSIVEWAKACGFKTPDPGFVESLADQQILPPRSYARYEDGLDDALAKSKETKFSKRATTALPIELGDFNDDSTDRRTKRRKTSKGKRKTAAQNIPAPTNRGTPRDFVEMMLEAKEAKKRMVQCNMRLVATIARKHARDGMSVQDLIQEGSIGLATAADKFDPTRGVKFGTYATWWIRQKIFRSIGNQSRTIRLPMHIHNLLIQMRKVRAGLKEDLGRTPTSEEVAQQLNMTVAKYNELMGLTQRSISIETPKYQENAMKPDYGRGSLLLSETAQSDEINPEQQLDHLLAHEDIQKILETLDEDERRVISARYGLEDGFARSVSIMAKQLNQSTAWVRSKEGRALTKLRKPKHKKRLEEHQESLTS